MEKSLGSGSDGQVYPFDRLGVPHGAARTIRIRRIRLGAGRNGLHERMVMLRAIRGGRASDWKEGGIRSNVDAHTDANAHLAAPRRFRGALGGSPRREAAAYAVNACLARQKPLAVWSSVGCPSPEDQNLTTPIWGVITF